MARDTAVRRPTPAQRQAIRRRRSWAGLAVVLCVAADVWSVSWAGADQPLAEGSMLRASNVALLAGTAPAVSIDRVERVPYAATDSSVSGGGSGLGGGTAGGPGAAGAAGSDTAGDGRDATGALVEKGSGTFAVIAMPATALKPAPAGGRVVRYTVELEGGLDIRALDLATTVGSVLTDPRGWQTKDDVRFVDVSPADAAKGAPVDLRITLASPTTTDRLCAPLETRGRSAATTRGGSCSTCAAGCSAPRRTAATSRATARTSSTTRSATASGTLTRTAAAKARRRRS